LIDRSADPTELVGALQRRGELPRPAKRASGIMLDLRTLDPARQSADRRVALVAGFGADAVLTFAAVTAGGGGWALATGGALALAALPWYFAFGARWRLLDDALDGVPFVWRGDRSGVWATAPAAGALASLVLVAALGFPPFLALLSCLAGAALYTALLATAEARYERAILLDLTVLELRFQRIANLKGSDPFRLGRVETDAAIAVPEPDRA
jgi:hypothetical protein